jgi:stage III sporulation protein AB
MWQKLVAAGCVMTGAFGFGMSLCGEMNSDISYLKVQKQMLMYMIGEISYLHRPMEEIFDILSEKISEPYDDFLKNMSDKMRERSGKSLRNLWYAAIYDIEEQKKLSPIGIVYLKKMADCFDCEGDRLQIEALGLLERELDGEIDRLTEKKEENSRLIRVLSTLAGVLCVVLFL